MWTWKNATNIPAFSYTCHYCGKHVGVSHGYYATDGIKGKMYLHICSYCEKPTFEDANGKLTPSSRAGGELELQKNPELKFLYDEARDCTGVGAFTSAVMLCRKILMHVGVDKGAEQGKRFEFYVNFLDEKGWIPPNGKNWVDKIRTFGNEANHEIKVFEKGDATRILTFTEYMLRFAYDFAGEED